MIRSGGPRQRVISALAAAAVLTALWGCAGKPPPAPKADKPPPELRAEVIAAPNANRDPTGRVLPIVVRLYELKAEGSFAGADFFSLYDKEAATLGGTLIAREEVTLVPGQRRLVVLPLSPEATHLGVVGAFNDLDRAGWRALEVLKPAQNNTVQVDVGASAITAQQR